MHPPRYARESDIEELEILAGELLPGIPVPVFRVDQSDHFCVIIHGGYVYARVERWNGERVAFVLSAAALPTALPEHRREAYRMLEEWSQKRGVGRIMAFTKTPEVFLKHWGFLLESFVISKTVT
jgi:hypothetical protein